MYYLIILIPLLASCSSSDDLFSGGDWHQHVKGEYIYRQHDEYFYNPPLPELVSPPQYSWDSDSKHPKITKEFFRCRGSAIHPELVTEVNGELKTFYDCEGDDSHGLPLRGGKEFIYPILIDLLNYLQQQTGQQIIITSGHRCPTHNSYIDHTKENLYSKHMIGAEVSFYVEGLEYKPQEVISLLREYYANEESSDYSSFLRYEKSNTNVRTMPWYNKEIFVKLFEPDEGRNLENEHPYPYISIQVRYDRELDKKVSYSWNEANRNFLRR